MSGFVRIEGMSELMWSRKGWEQVALLAVEILITVVLNRIYAEEFRGEINTCDNFV